jgi:recA bacterial DNA recombination protein
MIMKQAISKAAIESELTARFASAFQPREKAPALLLATGITALDAVVGGLPRSGITEIFGPASSGRTSVLLGSLAWATTHEEVCALVDTNDTLDPESAVAAGVDLERLLWIRCNGKLEHAFKAIDLLLQGGGFGLVVLDLGDVPTKDVRRVISSWWYRFRRTIENTPDSCVRACASLTLEMKRDNEVWSPAASVMAPFVRQQNDALIFNRTKQSSGPSHANLLCGTSFSIEQRRPLVSSPRSAEFEAFETKCRIA